MSLPQAVEPVVLLMVFPALVGQVGLGQRLRSKVAPAAPHGMILGVCMLAVLVVVKVGEITGMPVFVVGVAVDALQLIKAAVAAKVKLALSTPQQLVLLKQ